MKHIELILLAEMLPKRNTWSKAEGDIEDIDIDEDTRKLLLSDERKIIYEKIEEWRTSLNPSPPIRMKDPYFGVIVDIERFVLEVFLSVWKETTSFNLYKKVEIN